MVSLSTWSQSPKVEVAIDSIQMFIGEQTTLHVGVTVKNGQRVKMPVYQPLDNIIPGIEVVETLTTDTESVDNGFITVRSHYVLTSFDDTLYALPPIKVNVDGKEYESNKLALKVLAVGVDTLHPNQFFPQKDVQENVFLWSEWTNLLILSALLLLMVLAIIAMFIRLKSKKPLVFRVRIVKRVPPHQKALNLIEEIKPRSNTVSTEDAKYYYTQLTDALRKYMGERFGFNAMEMTSAEIIERLREEKDQQKLDELTMLFETSDLVKFAKYSVGASENDRNLISAVNFINETKQENAPTEERIQPSVTEEDKQVMRTRISLKWGIGILTVLSVSIVVYIVYQLIMLLVI